MRSQPSSTNAVPAAVSLIEPQKLAADLHGEQPPFLLDVREPAEVEQEKIEGATNIPLGELPFRLEELPKDKMIAVYCRSGRRSAQAARFLQGNGFKVEDLAGGINAWTMKRQCLPGKGTC